MGSRRHLSWSQAQRDLRADRAVRPDIREESLKAVSHGARMSAWRGKSGHRYVAAVRVAEDPLLTGTGNSVLFAVHRDERGVASIVSVACDLDVRSYREWRADVLEGGASEIHVHSLTEGPEGRRAVAEDVWGEPIP